MFPWSIAATPSEERNEVLRLCHLSRTFDFHRRVVGQQQSPWICRSRRNCLRCISVLPWPLQPNRWKIIHFNENFAERISQNFNFKIKISHFCRNNEIMEILTDLGWISLLSMHRASTCLRVSVFHSNSCLCTHKLIILGQIFLPWWFYQVDFSFPRLLVR